METRLFRLAALLLCGAAARAQTSGGTPGQLFQAGVSARALGMGSAYTAVGGEAASLYYNPAGLALMPGREAEAMHAALYGGASYDYIGYAQNFPRTSGGWGAEVLRLGVGGIDGRDAADNPTGSFGYSELGGGAGFGLADVLTDGLSLGAGLTGEQRSLLGHTNSLAGVDAGAQYGPFLGERMTVGLALTNAAAFAEGTSDRLAAGARLGASYSPLDPLLLTLDVANGGDVRAGAEYRYGETLALRAGWTPSGPTFGGGIIFDPLTFDAAVLENSALGISEQISLGYRFGAYRTKRRSNLALENLVRAKNALERRDYVKAGGLFDEAVKDDPAVGRKLNIDGGGWRRKIERLHRLLAEWRPSEAEQDDLRAPTVEAELAQSSVRALMDGNPGDAVLLAQVAAGEGTRGSVYARLPAAMAKAAGRPEKKGDTLSVAAFVEDRVRRAGDAYYARRLDDAVEACRQNTLVQPESAAAWERLGDAYERAGRKAEAAAAELKSLSLDPTNWKLRDRLRAR